jgi:hypothetical protein
MDTRRVGADPVELLRRWVLAVLVIGLAGTVTELVLLAPDHYVTGPHGECQTARG